MQSNNKAPRSKINILMLAYIAFIMVGLPTGLLGVAWPTMRTDFALPLDAMGLLLISSTVGYFLASFFIALSSRSRRSSRPFDQGGGRKAETWPQHIALTG